MSEFITPFVSAAARQISTKHTIARRWHVPANRARMAEIAAAVRTLLIYDVDIVIAAAVEIARAARRGHYLPTHAAITLARANSPRSTTRVKDRLAVARDNGPRYYTRRGPVPAGVSDGRARAWLDFGVIA